MNSYAKIEKAHLDRKLDIALADYAHRPIHVISGEGVGEGVVEEYDGKRTLRAIRQRATRERCGGDRWCRILLSVDDGEPVDLA